MTFASKIMVNSAATIESSMIPLVKAKRSPRDCNWRGSSAALASREARVGKPENAVLAAMNSTPTVTATSTKNHTESSPAMVWASWPRIGTWKKPSPGRWPLISNCSSAFMTTTARVSRVRYNTPSSNTVDRAPR